MRKVSPVREDMSLIRLGTTGVYRENAFEVIGRIQYLFSEGYRNHWFILYHNGNTGWFGDWAGNYSFFKEAVYTSNKNLDFEAPGQKIELVEARLEVEVIDRIKTIYWEGEVTEQGQQELGYLSLELIDTVNRMGIIHVGLANTKPHAFVGEYVELSDLQLQNVRQHHEWL